MVVHAARRALGAERDRRLRRGQRGDARAYLLLHWLLAGGVLASLRGLREGFTWRGFAHACGHYAGPLLRLSLLVLALAFVAGAFTHYVYGGLQLPGRGPTTRAAYIHIGVLGALIALTRAASYWLDRYSLSTQKGSLLTGITYTDDNAVLPTKAILAVAAIMCAGFFLAAIWSRSWRLPATPSSATSGRTTKASSWTESATSTKR